MNTRTVSPSPRLWRYRLLLISIVGACIASGCATVTTYEERSSSAYNAYAWGASENAATSFAAAADQAGRGEKLLWQLEAAKAYQAAGDFETSRRWFEKAESTLRSFEDEATVVARDIGREAASLTTNPNTLAYKGLYADRIFLNTYQALNYLALHQLEGAAVEVRRALMRQQEAATVYAGEIARLHGANNWSDDDNADRLARAYQDVNASLTPAAIRFVNPLATWLRAVIYHMRGDFEQARYELHTLLNEGMNTPSVRTYHDAIIAMLEQGAPRQRWCFIVFENGRGPTLEETRLELIVPKLGLTALSLPKPRLRTPPFSSVQISSPGERRFMETLITANALFSAEFKAIFPGILARTLASYATKEVASRAIVNQAENPHQEQFAYIATGLYKYLTARSDTRVWQTRGNAFMVTAFPLPETGTITVRPVRADGGPVAPITLTPEPGKHLFAYLQGLVPDEIITVKQSFD